MVAARHPRNLDAGPLQPMINSHQLELARLGKAERTRKIYRESAQWFAAECLLPAGVTGWDQVTKAHLRSWCAALFGRDYADSYVNHEWRALQAFLKFAAAEDEFTNPMLGMPPPEVKPKPVPVFTDAQLDALFATCKGKDFMDRRDTAILMFLRDTGLRLNECAGLNLGDVDLLAREATVTGKGEKVRTVKYSFDAARALDRYLRAREKRLLASDTLRADLPALWVGRLGRLSDSGIYQIVERRGEQAGLDIYPHKFRHHFSHTWLDRGGAEGDLMELNGWESPQMLRRYGRSAASARARRGYDRVMGEGG
jgi:site-specific recombinase XerD